MEAGAGLRACSRAHLVDLASRGLEVGDVLGPRLVVILERAHDLAHAYGHAWYMGMCACVLVLACRIASGTFSRRRASMSLPRLRHRRKVIVRGTPIGQARTISTAKGYMACARLERSTSCHREGCGATGASLCTTHRAGPHVQCHTTLRCTL